MSHAEYQYQDKEQAEEEFYERYEGVVVSRRTASNKKSHAPGIAQEEPLCRSGRGKGTRWHYKSFSQLPPGWYGICTRCLDILGLYSCEENAPR